MCWGPLISFCPFLQLLMEGISVIAYAVNKRLKSVLRTVRWNKELLRFCQSSANTGWPHATLKYFACLKRCSNHGYWSPVLHHVHYTWGLCSILGLTLLPFIFFFFMHLIFPFKFSCYSQACTTAIAPSLLYSHCYETQRALGNSYKTKKSQAWKYLSSPVSAPALRPGSWAFC